MRLLSEVTGARRQDQRVERHIVLWMKQIFLPGDKVAFLTANVSDKPHVVDLLKGIDVAAFTSRIPAEQWLLLDPVHID
jgi:hypothetical protein